MAKRKANNMSLQTTTVPVARENDSMSECWDTHTNMHYLSSHTKGKPCVQVDRLVGRISCKVIKYTSACQIRYTRTDLKVSACMCVWATVITSNLNVTEIRKTPVAFGAVAEMHVAWWLAKCCSHDFGSCSDDTLQLVRTRSSGDWHSEQFQMV